MAKEEVSAAGLACLDKRIVLKPFAVKKPFK
jgi:hypothetical protein